MSGSRVERVADQVKELVSQLLSFEVRDPGVGLVTVTHVKVTGDLQLAQVYYTIIGDARERRETAKALERATAFVRRRVAENLNLRRAPELRFHYDDHVERQERVETLLQQIAAEREALAAADAGQAPAPDASADETPPDAPRQDQTPD